MGRICVLPDSDGGTDAKREVPLRTSDTQSHRNERRMGGQASEQILVYGFASHGGHRKSAQRLAVQRRGAAPSVCNGLLGSNFPEPLMPEKPEKDAVANISWSCALRMEIAISVGDNQPYHGQPIRLGCRAARRHFVPAWSSPALDHNPATDSADGEVAGDQGSHD